MKPKLTEKVYKVYVTYYTDGSYYIGFTGKSGSALASYFKTDDGMEVYKAILKKLR